MTSNIKFGSKIQICRYETGGMRRQLKEGGGGDVALTPLASRVQPINQHLIIASTNPKKSIISAAKEFSGARRASTLLRFDFKFFESIQFNSI